jgi:hypothetical protein
MQYYVEKLDRRHTGWQRWRYRLRIQNDFNLAKTHYKNFHTLRAWMIEQYGLSAERDQYDPIANSCKEYELFDPPWCWHIDRDYPNNMYIYVKNNEVLSNITLKWSA